MRRTCPIELLHEFRIAQRETRTQPRTRGSCACVNSPSRAPSVAKRVGAAVQVSHRNTPRRPSCRVDGWRQEVAGDLAGPVAHFRRARRTPLIKGPTRSAGSAKAAAAQERSAALPSSQGNACQGPLQGGWAASIARRRHPVAAGSHRHSAEFRHSGCSSPSGRCTAERPEGKELRATLGHRRATTTGQHPGSTVLALA